MFKFRPISSKDFPLLLEWLSKKHVQEWWDDEDDTLEKVALHYGQNDDAERFILVETNEKFEKPIGYFQYYFTEEESVIGIDQFIGEEDYINRGIGEQAIELFVQMINGEHHPRSIILDPSPDNKRAIRCYEKVGFQYFETRKAYGGEGFAYMMRLDTDKLTR
jgi:RimJ/RimL family protein N-acetyltransferase